MTRERRLREGAYTGGSQMGVPFPGDDDQGTKDVDHVPAEPDADTDDDEGDDGDGDEGDDGGRAPVSSAGGGLAGAGAGWVLGMLLWGWVVLPFIKAGPVGVKNTLMAKFANRAPDGSPLP